MISSRTRKNHNDSLISYRKIIIKAIFFILFLATVFFFIAKVKTYFPIKSVKVFGIKHIDQSTMQQALIPFVSKGFFAIDVESIKDRVLQYPWVSNAIVQRIWPDQILITVIEKKPIASWNNSSLLSSNGEIFNPEQKSYPNGLPKLIGPDGQHLQVWQYFQKISGMLAPLHFRIARFELMQNLSCNLIFDNGIKLSANSKDVLTRMNHFVKVYPKIVGNRVAAVDYIDLRYPNGLAVKWKTIT